MDQEPTFGGVFPTAQLQECIFALSFALGWKLDPSWILQLGNRVQRCNALYVDVSGHGVCWSSLCALVSQYVMSHRSLLKRLLENHIIYRHLRYLLFTLYEFLSISLHPFFILSHHLFRSSFYCGLFNLFPKVGRFVKPRRPWACAKVSQTRPWVVECQCFGPKLLKHVFSAFFLHLWFHFITFFSGFTMLHNKPLAQIPILGKPLCISLILFIISLSFSVQRSACFFSQQTGPRTHSFDLSAARHRIVAMPLTWNIEM